MSRFLNSLKISEGLAATQLRVTLRMCLVYPLLTFESDLYVIAEYYAVLFRWCTCDLNSSICLECCTTRLWYTCSTQPSEYRAVLFRLVVYSTWMQSLALFYWIYWTFQPRGKISSYAAGLAVLQRENREKIVSYGNAQSESGTEDYYCVCIHINLLVINFSKEYSCVLQHV